MITDRFSSLKFLLGLVALCIIVMHTTFASSSEKVFIPVPKNVIYAGQVVDGRLLRDRSVPAAYLNRVSVFTSPIQVVGKIARTTLMPNRPIPTNFLVEPNAVEVNRKALMRFENAGLKITTEVIPLNAAKAGEPVRARNAKTGVVVYGTANADGSISVNRLN
jgi:flagella basal body P-ring formation protein FlgA